MPCHGCSLHMNCSCHHGIYYTMLNRETYSVLHPLLNEPHHDSLRMQVPWDCRCSVKKNEYCLHIVYRHSYDIFYIHWIKRRENNLACSGRFLSGGHSSK